MLHFEVVRVSQFDPAELLANRARAGVDDALIEILGLAAVPGIISFAGGFPAPETFPRAALSTIMSELVESADFSAFQYSPIEGLPSMLELVAERLEHLEGQRPETGELLITSGGIDGLGLISRSYLDRGDAVIVEGPTYLGALMAFRGFEAEVVMVPMDTEEGIDVDALEAAIAKRPPKLLYTIPDFQNPAGVSMSSQRRVTLVELARQYGFLVVEDVAYRELGFDDSRFPSLWSLAPDVVVQLGTFSKTFFPGVRLGWAAGPIEVIQQLTLAKQNSDQCAGSLGQRLFEGYSRGGYFEEQNRLARSLYRQRCNLMLGALQDSMPPAVSWTVPKGGFFTWLTLPKHVDAHAMAREARLERIAFVAGGVFFANGRGRNNIRLSFSNVGEDQIPEGVERLSRLVRAAV